MTISGVKTAMMIPIKVPRVLSSQQVAYLIIKSNVKTAQMLSLMAVAKIDARLCLGQVLVYEVVRC